jgi:hypothetical protein
MAFTYASPDVESWLGRRSNPLMTGARSLSLTDLKRRGLAMDISSGFELIAAALGIPASIYALFQIYRDRQKPVEDADLAHQKYFEVQKRLSELPNRVLLTFSNIIIKVPFLSMSMNLYTIQLAFLEVRAGVFQARDRTS